MVHRAAYSILESFSASRNGFITAEEVATARRDRPAIIMVIKLMYVHPLLHSEKEKGIYRCVVQLH